MYGKSGLLLVAVVLLASCASMSEEERQIRWKRTIASYYAYCSFENLIYEDTGEYTGGYLPPLDPNRRFMSNWHITQCKGRDPEPLVCRFQVFFDPFSPHTFTCKTENGEEDYRYLSGLIESD